MTIDDTAEGVIAEEIWGVDVMQRGSPAPPGLAANLIGPRAECRELSARIARQQILH